MLLFTLRDHTLSECSTAGVTFKSSPQSFLARPNPQVRLLRGLFSFKRCTQNAWKNLCTEIDNVG